MGYKILICDDEKLHRQILREELEKYFENTRCSYEIIEASSGEDVLGHKRTGSLDIAFLDIELADMKGIELSTKLKAKNEKVLIIFVTSYSDYMGKAFEQFVFNYIMKPVESKIFSRIMDKALEEIEYRRNNSLKKYFTIVYKKKMSSILYEDIICFEKRLNNLIISLENDKMVIRYSLKRVEEVLDTKFFLRCHRGFIVNKERIIVQQGNYLTLIGHNEKIPIGEKYRDHVNTEISKMLRGRRG